MYPFIDLGDHDKSRFCPFPSKITRLPGGNLAESKVGYPPYNTLDSIFTPTFCVFIYFETPFIVVVNVPII